ncbi:MAG TPA: hypothetical protein DDW52_01190 [Planctomycetaceae bacterium]|nr:hypothetical protein [Planctomycetaceae bacterium]
MNAKQVESVAIDLPLRVLVVDDDAAMCKSLQRLLTLDHYSVEFSYSVQELLARKDLSTFFAILLDRHLPDGDTTGQTIAAVRSQAENAAIVIVTGYADIESTLEAIRQGVDDYLIKPIDPDTLRARLKALAKLFRARSSLRESEARMRFLVEHLPAGAVYVDNEKLYMNLTLRDTIGYSEVEISTVSAWFEKLCRDQAAECKQKYCQVKREGFSQRCKLPIWRKDGVRRVLEIAGYQYDHHEVWLVTDVTELDDAQTRLVQAERLAAIGEMVTGLAHESRNALQRARGCLDLLELDLEKQSEQLDLIARIRRSLGDLQRNYEEVRNYAAPIVLDRQWIDIAEVAAETFADLECEYPNSRRTLNFDDSTPNSIRYNHVDRHRISQVLRNVFDNAIAATRDDSQLELSIRTNESNGQQTQRIEITDNGAGMSQETATRLFEPFYTTKQSGTGLGMAICKRIVDEHNGSIEASSTDQGTTISIVLPQFALPTQELSSPSHSLSK